mgnify:CR=1 FL=1
MDKMINNSISSISQLHTLTADFLIDELAKKGLSNIASSHGNILFQLSKVESLSMGELAQKINRDKSTTTVLIRKLIKENLVTECINENDKRNKKISLTEKGKEYTSITSEISTSLLQKFYNGFSEDEKKTVFYLLDKILSNFN